MRFAILFCLFCFLPWPDIQAQPQLAEHTAAPASAPGTDRYWLFFTDKGPGQAAALRRGFDPIFSPRAIARRGRSASAPDFRDVPVYTPYVSTVKDLPGVTVHMTSRWFNAVSISLHDPLILADLATLPMVSHLQPVRQYRVPKTIQAEAPPQAAMQRQAQSFAVQDQLIPVPGYGPAANQVAMLGVDYLHEQNFRGQGVLVAVLDGGFRGVDVQPAYQRYWNENRIVDAWNFERGNDSVFAFSSHGTAVLSCIGGVGENGTYYGTAPEARFALYLTEVVGFERLIEEDYWVAGAERADALGADIINTSLGYTTFDSVDAAMNHTYADMDGNTTIISRGADIAASRGILVVASAGNQGGTNWRYISAPADGDSVLAVGAVDQEGNYAFFSSLGPSADGDVKPNVAAVGFGTWVQNQFGEVTQGNGTSFAAPLMAGAAASLLSAVPGTDNMTLFDAIQQSASQFNTPDDSLGYGIPNFASAFHRLRGIPPAPETAVLAAWPNPLTGDRMWVWLDDDWSDDPLAFTLLDAQGREIRAWTTQLVQNEGQAYPISGLDDLAPGTYVLRVLQAERLRTVKVVKATQGSSAFR